MLPHNRSGQKNLITFGTVIFDTSITITVPAIADTDTTISASLSKDGIFVFNGREYSSPGTYTDTLTTYAGCDSVVTFNISAYTPSSIIATATQPLTFSPNPVEAGQDATITLPDDIDLDNITVEIINSSGQPVTNYVLSPATHVIRIPYSSFPMPGIYLVRITTDKIAYTGKLIVE